MSRIASIKPGRCIRRWIDVAGRPWILLLSNTIGEPHMAMAPLGTRREKLRWRSFQGVLRDAFAYEFAEQLTMEGAKR